MKDQRFQLFDSRQNLLKRRPVRAAALFTLSSFFSSDRTKRASQSHSARTWVFICCCSFASSTDNQKGNLFIFGSTFWFQCLSIVDRNRPPVFVFLNSTVSPQEKEKTIFFISNQKKVDRRVVIGRNNLNTVDDLWSDSTCRLVPVSSVQLSVLARNRSSRRRCSRPVNFYWHQSSDHVDRRPGNVDPCRVIPSQPADGRRDSRQIGKSSFCLASQFSCLPIVCVCVCAQRAAEPRAARTRR